MPKKAEVRKNNKDKKKNLKSVGIQQDNNTIHVGNISGGKGFAIGSNARSLIIEIGSLFDLRILFIVARNHWIFLITSLALQGIAYISWRQFTDRFLISPLILIGGMLLLELSLFSIYFLSVSQNHRYIISFIGVTSLLTLTGLTSHEYYKAVHPPKFDTEIFGVAIAHFGEGPEFQNTAKAREISQLVLNQLTQQAQENPELRFVQFRSIGLVRNETEAFEEGKKIHADLVIWGGLQISDFSTTLNFAILETPDKISNPTFPRVIPFIERSVNGALEIPGHNSKEIAKGTTTIAAFTFGLAHLFNWDFAPSALAFQQALETAPTGSDNYRYLLYMYYGLSLQWPGQLELADEQFKLATILQPNDPAAILAMAFGNRSLGNFEDSREQAKSAYDLITQYIKFHPENAKAYYDRALANEMLGRWDSSLRDYQAAVQNEPDLYIAHIGVIRMNLVLDQTAKAIEAAQDTIELTEANGANAAWAYLYLAQAYERENDTIQAKLTYQKATALAPQIDWFHFKAGEFYTSVGELENAEKEYKTMIEVSSNKVWANSLLAEFYANHGRPTDAITSYLDALQIDPTVSGLWVALADIYERSGKIEEVYNSYKRAIEEEPNNLYARSKYGYFLYSQGDFSEAIIQWEAASKIDPQGCDILLNLGSAYENIANTERAKNIYTKILSLDENRDSNCLTEAKRRLDLLMP